MSYGNDYNHGQQQHYIPSDPVTPVGEYTPYASTDHFAAQDYIGQDSSGRRDVYPPRGGEEGFPTEGGYGAYEKGVNPVTRGSIAAQLAAEGQIPRKEGLRMWRQDEHAGALTRGGKARCCGRVCVCSFLLAIIIVVSIVASFLLWTRPPDITFNGIEAPSNGSEVATQTDGFLLNFQLNIGVINPNFFGVSFREIKAVAQYSTAPTVDLGGGVLDNVDIKKYSNTTILFPFTINYTLSEDPNFAIVKDIATKCGFLGSTTKEDLTIDYTITLGLKILSSVISPSFSSSTSLACPLQESDLSGILGGLGSLRARSLDPVSGSDLVERKLHVNDLSWDRRWELQQEMSRAMGIIMRRGAEQAARGWEGTGRRWR